MKSSANLEEPPFQSGRRHAGGRGSCGGAIV